MPNRLAKSTSPYLQQHAENPVEWYPWGKEALDRARKEGKPILLSVGYSSCHWCHVMAHESFEDPATAAYMNEHFINIKVDREERPDIDHIYMATVQAMTGHGGWPLTAFLTPEGVPFYGGTYWPAEERQGMPAFRTVLEAVVDAYEKKPEEITSNVEQMTVFLQSLSQQSPKPGNIDVALLDSAVNLLVRQFDQQHGGFGGAPKFPQPAVLDFLMRAWHRTREPRLEAMVHRTLEQMAAGGIYDQLGGGFHRYAVDAGWLVPHFEKMLYDNALLARVYLEAWRAWGNPLYRRIVEETLDWTLREMTGERGQFFSALDADTEGEEGLFYVWTPADLEGVLDKVDSRLVKAVYGVTPAGNFEGANILSVVRPVEDVAAEMGIDAVKAERRFNAALLILLAERNKRTRPGVDDKTLANWNAMMIAVMTEAGAAFRRVDYLNAASKAAKFLLNQMRPGETFRHTWSGKIGAVPAFLDDYAHTIGALISLYETTFKPVWIEEAIAMADEMIALFRKEDGPGFYDTGSRHEGLVARPRELNDGATPAGNSVAAEVLQDLAAMTGRREYADIAAGIVQMMAKPMAEQPLSTGRFLAAAERYLALPREIAIAGKRSQNRIFGLGEVVWQRYEPNAVLGLADPDGAPLALPFLENRKRRDGKPAAYLCERFACMPPVTSPAELNRLLDQGTGIAWREF